MNEIFTGSFQVQCVYVPISIYTCMQIFADTDMCLYILKILIDYFIILREIYTKFQGLPRSYHVPYSFFVNNGSCQIKGMQCAYNCVFCVLMTEVTAQGAVIDAIAVLRPLVSCLGPCLGFFFLFYLNHRNNITGTSKGKM